MKKIILLICSLLMIMCAGISADASYSVAKGQCGSNLSWVLYEDGTLTINGTGKMPEWSVNSSSEWSSFKDDIVKIIIENGVTSIGSWAFKDLSNLVSVEISDSVTSIGSFSFYKCTGLTDVIMGNGIKVIGNNAFDCCNSLESITIPDSVAKIGCFAFNYCLSLKNIILSDSVAFICNCVFENTGYYKDENNWENGVLYIGKCLVATKSTIEGICEIKEGTVTIANSAYNNRSNLIGISIPDSVIRIGCDAFSACSGLRNITIPKNVNSIGEYAFNACTGLTGLTLESSSVSIGNDAFYRCNNINDIYYYGRKKEFNKLQNLPDCDNVIYKKIIFESLEYTNTSIEYNKESVKVIVTPFETIGKNHLIIALYKENDPVYIKVETDVDSGNPITIIPEDEFDTVKIMLWKDISNLIPVYNLP